MLNTHQTTGNDDFFWGGGVKCKGGGNLFVSPGIALNLR